MKWFLRLRETIERLFSRRELGKPEKWVVEVQVHPANRSRRVRTYFVTRRGLTTISIVAVLYLFLVALGTALARDAVRTWLGGREVSSLAVERARQGERLQELLEGYAAVEAQSQRLGTRLAKVRLAYGLPSRRPRRGAPNGQAGVEGPNDERSIWAGSISRGTEIERNLQATLASLEISLAQLRTYEAAHAEEVRQLPSACPLRGASVVLSVPFGRHRNPFTRELELHPGLDLAAPRGERVVAPADGVVAFAGRYPLRGDPAWWRLGNLVLIRHGDRYATIFGHLEEVVVRAGQKVRRGERLGTVGASGWAPSPQLHYEVRRKLGNGLWAPVDPRIYTFDRNWPDEERLLDRGAQVPPAGSYPPLPGS